MEIKEIILKNILIRYKVLEFLYLANQDNKRPSFKEIIENLNFTELEINQQMKFLEKEGLANDERRCDGKPYNIKITSEGQRFIEEIELSKESKGKKISQWLLVNASWIIPYIPKILELIKKATT